MKITRIEPIELLIPWNDRVEEPMSRRSARTFVYKFFSDDGIVGVGEGGDVRDSLDKYIDRDPLDFLMGSDPEPVQEAIYDMLGKSLGVPAHRLIGQQCRELVEAVFWSCDMSPERIAAEALVAVESGYFVHKLKVRPWEDFIEQAERIFAVAPEGYRLRPDCNGHRWPDFFTVDRLLGFARKLERHVDRIDYWEGPIEDRNLSGLAFLRSTGMQVSLHANPEWAALCCRHDACDFFQIGGPLDSTVKTAHVAEATGHRAVAVELAGAGAGAGINTVWAVHIGAVLPNATRAVDTVPDLRVASVITEPLRPVEGFFPVPDAPGLGVELDEDVIRRFRGD